MLLNSNLFYILLIITLLISGCTRNAPIIDPVKDIHQSQVAKKKIPAKAGIYLSNDLKQYVYTQQKSNIPFQMRVGDYLSPISMTMGSTLFNDVIVVNALPPYDDSYRPNVEAVIKPEIIFHYANTVGAFLGYIEAKIKLRVTVYDLGGNILWQDEAIGESRRDDMKEAYKAGYQATSSAAASIVNDFYAKTPQQLFSFLDVKDEEDLKNRGALFNFELFKKLYEKGQFQYNKKNYSQSLYLFKKASNISPAEPAAIFYTGASYIYTGEKDRALKKFAEVIKKKASTQEADDSRKWIQRLNDPLKIGIINGNKANKSGLNDGVIQDTLINSKMYNVINTSELVSPNNRITSSASSKFLNKCYKQGIKVIIVYDVESSSQKAQSNHYLDEDVATEHWLRISAKVYSTKKKQLKTELLINERSDTIQEQTMEKAVETRQQLLQSGARKLVLQLLKNDIF